MLISAHQLNYLPYAGYFAKIIKSDAFMFIQKVQFEKKSWQNRNKILTKNGIVMLSVPVLSKDKFSQNIEEVRINNDTPWRSKHFKSIVLAYNKTPFFKRYIEFFEDIYQKEWEFLKDIDYAITLFFINELGIKTPLYYDKDFDLRGKKNDLLIDICKALKADTYLSNEGSADYVDINYLNAHHIEHYFCRYTEQTPPPCNNILCHSRIKRCI